MKHISFLAAVLGLGVGRVANHQAPAPRAKAFKPHHLPRQYPGAKLARKAMQGTVGRAVIR